MVTRAGKELLKNTMNTVKLHNRIIEENEMWRQWEVERGLTMMVSDDVLKSKHHSSSGRKKKCKSKHKHHGQRGCSSNNVSPEKWDHGGFEELYPEICNLGKSSASTSRQEVSPPRHTSNHGKNAGKSQNFSKCEDIESSDSEEIWEDFRSFKKKKSDNCSIAIASETSHACSSSPKYQKLLKTYSNSIGKPLSEKESRKWRKHHK